MRDLASCRRAVDLAERQRHADPGRALTLAEDALAAAAALGAGTPREAWLELQIEAWAVLGSALRATSQLRRAEQAFLVATSWLDALEHEALGILPGGATVRGGADIELLRARLAQRISYLRRDQERFDEALELIQSAHRAFRAHGQVDLAIGAFADRGSILGRSGRRWEAIAHQIVAIEEGLCLDAEGSRADRRILGAAMHNLALNLSEVAETVEDVHEALAWLRLAGRLQEGFEEPLNEAKMLSIEGALEVKAGDRARGIGFLVEAARRLGELAAPFEQAGILLHLAEIHLADHRSDLVRRVAGRIFPICRALELNREARDALLFFLRAEQADNLTVDLIEEADRRLRRAKARA